MAKQTNYLYMKINFIVVLTVLGLPFFSCKSKKEVKTTDTVTETKPDKKPEVITVDVVTGLNLGNKAPEIEQANPQGATVKLSSFKGKLVLIDFWASWCGPCRLENPAVVSAYGKYHESKFKNGNGFEILSVSLDSNKDAWIKAIEKDKLIWPHHVSDLAGWNNAVAIRYGVNTIPTNVLIDGNGIIIAKNLRGEALEQAIQVNLK